jgi:hypothetical protein
MRSIHTVRARVGKLAPAALVGLALPGCVAINGNQRAVTADDVAASNKFAACPTQRQATSYENAAPGNGPDQKATIRDNVIRECVKAIDRNYLAFKVGLHKESSVANLVTDIASLGLTSGASLATGKTAQRLAAGGAFVLGSGSAINKDVFYSQTLPAVEASMDAQRDRLLTEIITASKTDPAGTSYTLNNAGIALGAYERAGDVYAAISELTKTAAASAVAEKSKLDAAQAQPPIDLGVFLAVDSASKADYFTLLRSVNALDLSKAGPDASKFANLAAYAGVDLQKYPVTDDARVPVIQAIHKKIFSLAPDKRAGEIDTVNAIVN